MLITICHHLSLSYGGGGEWAAINMANEAVKRGHEVIVRSLPFWKGDLNPRDFLDPRVKYEESLHFRKIESDVSYFLYAPFLRRICRVHGPKIAGFHSMLWTRGPVKGYGKMARLAFLYWRLAKESDLKMFNAFRVYFRELISLLSLKRIKKPIYVIGQEVETDIFRPREKGEEFTVLYVGRPVRQKGFDIFLEVAQKVNARFLLVGTDEKYENVESLGYIKDRRKLADIMGSSHLLLSPQRVPTLSRAVLESLSSGTPALITVDVMEPYRVPAIIRSREKEVISRVEEVKRIWEKDRDKYYNIANSGRELVLRLHSKERVMEKLFKMFNIVAEKFSWTAPSPLPGRPPRAKRQLRI